MRTCLIPFIVCVVCSVGWAEHPELTAMKASSRRALAGYAAKFAADARWKLAMMDPNHMREHVSKFLDLIATCGCEDPAFFRRQFQLDENTPGKPPQTSPTPQEKRS